jgi:diguanylate cyclase (GGDEF)-like protein
MNTVRQSDLVCRIGGDEFAVLISNIVIEDMIEEIARRILVNVEKPFAPQGIGENISASVGISIYPNDGETLELLIKHADMAMYEVKKEGRNNYLFYQPYMSIHWK